MNDESAGCRKAEPLGTDRLGPLGFRILSLSVVIVSTSFKSVVLPKGYTDMVGHCHLPCPGSHLSVNMALVGFFVCLSCCFTSGS